jgi:hypothetical protein
MVRAVACAGCHGGFDDGALFHFGDARWNADHHTRAGKGAPVMHAADEVVQHALRDVEVGDDAVFERANGDDVTGRAAHHLLGGFAH